MNTAMERVLAPLLGAPIWGTLFRWLFPLARDCHGLPSCTPSVCATHISDCFDVTSPSKQSVGVGATRPEGTHDGSQGEAGESPRTHWLAIKKSNAPRRGA